MLFLITREKELPLPFCMAFHDLLFFPTCDSSLHLHVFPTKSPYTWSRIVKSLLKDLHFYTHPPQKGKKIIKEERVTIFHSCFLCIVSYVFLHVHV